MSIRQAGKLTFVQLPDREQLMDKLSNADAGQVLLAVSLRRFSFVNIDHNPFTGDEVLQAIADTCETYAEHYDGKVYHLGADWFAIVAQRIPEEAASGLQLECAKRLNTFGLRRTPLVKVKWLRVEGNPPDLARTVVSAYV